MSQMQQLGTRLERAKAEGVDLLAKETLLSPIRQFMEAEMHAKDLS
jgi:hypothetical protein